MSTRSTLERYAKAWETGDLGTVFDSYADGVVFHYFGDSDLAGTHIGDAALAAMAQASVRSSRTLLEVVDVLDGPVLGALVVRERFERDGQVAEVQRVLLYRVINDKIAECWLYDEDQALIDGFWAPPVQDTQEAHR
jgi:hypothetical protein